MFDASRIVHVADRLALKRGGELAEVQLACETRGQRNASDTNTVLLFVGLSPVDHVCASVKDPSPGWWEWMVDAGKPLDTDACHVICVNRLGSCFGSTSPASINPATRKPYGSDFPELSIGDMARITVRRALVVGLESDTVYPIHQQRALADLLCEQGHDAEYVAMPSIQGARCLPV